MTGESGKRAIDDCAREWRKAEAGDSVTVIELLLLLK